MERPSRSPRHSPFEDWLAAELARRRAANPRLSLRSFARRLGMSHSTLSQILRRRRLTPIARIATIGRRLGLDEGAIADHRDRRRALSPGHRALLRLVDAPGFRPDSRWLGRRLGLTSDEVNIRLQRLLRLGCLALHGREWRVAPGWSDRRPDPKEDAWASP